MKEVKIYVSGCALTNPGHAGCGVVLVCGEHQKELIIPTGQATNNRAELQAMIEGLKALKTGCDVDLYSSSEVTVKSSGFAVGTKQFARNSNMDLWSEWNRLTKGYTIETLRVYHVRKDTHELNTRARALANEAANESAMNEAS